MNMNEDIFCLAFHWVDFLGCKHLYTLNTLGRRKSEV